MGENETKIKGVKQRFETVRLRTWTLTGSIVIALIFYFVVTVSTKQTISWIDFVLLCIMQFVTHSTYFPDGDLFGQKDSAYQRNKEAYNEKANEINKQRKINRLREYCKFEYEERKQRYIETQCGILGITLEELEELKQREPKEIAKLETFSAKTTVDGEEREKLIRFTKHKRKILYNLCFKPLPIEENHPETIMSAVENDGNSAIKDTSKSYKVMAYVSKIFKAIIIGGIFAYIGYTARDGFGWTEVVSITMYLTTLLTTAVTSFSSGEVCSRVHKSRFYLDLSNFIDGFNEWEQKTYKENG